MKDQPWDLNQTWTISRKWSRFTNAFKILGSSPKVLGRKNHQMFDHPFRDFCRRFYSETMEENRGGMAKPGSFKKQLLKLTLRCYLFALYGHLSDAKVLRVFTLWTFVCTLRCSS